MIPRNVYELCRGDLSVSSELAKNSTLSPHDACKKLFGVDADDQKVTKKVETSKESPEDLEQAFQCGKWGKTRPSDLFLRVRIQLMSQPETGNLLTETLRYITMSYARWRRILWLEYARLHYLVAMVCAR